MTAAARALLLALALALVPAPARGALVELADVAELGDAVPGLALCRADQVAPAGVCVCAAGYYYVDASSCAPCAAGSYNAEPGDQVACTACPAGATTLPGATDAAECLCPAGTSAEVAGESFACAACAADSYKTVASNTAACASCPPNSSAPAGATEPCLCAPGHTRESSECAACPEDTVKTEVGDGACTPCPAHMSVYAEPALECLCDAGAYYDAAGTCTPCGASETSALNSTGAAACVCASGFEGTAGACVACTAGKFSAQTWEGLLPDLACSDCAANTTSDAGADACVCAAGFGWDIDYQTCLACAAGTAKAGAGNEPCALCGANEYSLEGATACSACPAGATSPPGSPSPENCSCAAGGEIDVTYAHPEECTLTSIYSGRVMPPCPEVPAWNGYNWNYDTIKWQQPVIGETWPQHNPRLTGPVRDYCLPSADQYIFDMEANAAALRDSNQYGWIGFMEDRGFRLIANAHPGTRGQSYIGEQKFTYNSQGAVDACLADENCRYIHGYQNKCHLTFCSDWINCKDIRNAANKLPEHSLFFEKVGYLPASCDVVLQAEPTVLANVQCSACPAGTFSAAAGDPCTDCPAKTFSDAPGALACDPCPDNSTSAGGASSIEQCLCDAGFRRVGSECVACSEGYIKLASGNDECTACAADTHWVASDEACQACPDASWTDGATAQTSIDACVCPAGYEPAVDTRCAVCAANSYCAGTDAKAPCPTNSTSPPGSDALADCTCAPGTWRRELGVCAECTPDHYCTGDNTRTPCHPDSAAPAGSSAPEDCVCVGGYELV